MRNIKIGTVMSLALVLALFLSLALSPKIQAQTPGIGVFNLEKALNDSKKGKEVRKKLEDKFKKMQKDMDDKGKEITKMETDLQKQAESNVLSQDALAKKASELREKIRSFQEQMDQYNGEMAKAEEDALKPLVDKAIATATDLGEDRGYFMVLEMQQAGVIYFDESMDLTAEVIKVLDK